MITGLFVRHVALRLFATVLALLAVMGVAQALEPVSIGRDTVAVDLMPAVELHRGSGNNFQVSTVPGVDGIVRRIEVESSSANPSGNWAVFSLANNADTQIDRLVVAPHFKLAGSGVVWPDLGSRRIAAITPSEGFALDRQESSEADLFLVTLDPGSVITFVAELSSDRLPEIRLWEPNAYKDTVNAFTLYRGIVLGIAGLLAVFLTILFVVKGSAVFPATAALAWAVLAYICIDFDFWQKLVPIQPGQERLWRAGTEVAIAFTLVVFLYAYLNLNRWHRALSAFTVIWLCGLGGLGVLAAFEPAIASGVARMSMVAIAAIGAVLILALAIKGYDRAVMLIPTWALVCGWLVGAAMTVQGRIDNDIVQSALGGGLVLIVLLFGFTVMQHAFAGGTVSASPISDMERRSLALSGTGDAIWDWDVTRDRIYVGAEAEEAAGLPIRTMNGPARDWLPILHPDDRDRFKATLDAIIEHRRGRISQDFRVRGDDGHYHWMNLHSRPVLGSDGEVVRCVGTLKDVTGRRKSEERLLHDALHDQLTGLPNRELLLDRLDALAALIGGQIDMRPTVFVIDLDDFGRINEAYGVVTGDTVLLTVARRLRRVLKPQDSLARLDADRFAIILNSRTDIAEVAAFAEFLRGVIRAPIGFTDTEIGLTGSIGLTGWTEGAGAEELLKEAELAMYEAKRLGGDRIEPFRPSFKTVGSGRFELEADLRRAFARHELHVYFQPVIRVKDGTTAGFEALLRWEHPKRGLVPLAELVPVAEASGQLDALCQLVLDEAARRLSDWQRIAGYSNLFVCVDILSGHLLRQDLVNDVNLVLKRYKIAPETLRLEMTEASVMANPERTARVLERLRKMDVGLTLDEFGSGRSSLSDLMRFQFDAVKIDRSFLRGDRREERLMIYHSIIAMAHDLGLTVIAEGVENTADAEKIRQFKCDFIQSRMHSPAVSAEEARRRLQDRNGQKKVISKIRRTA
ncbi:sensor domain-containing phosphodiesterase [Aureimonas altamirensis]|nr:sensor domain-containing phosphodiesterase [Aureimonas altamirensis]UHD47359.1 sensor domain-containing phosphodiesterase [Aureimonas altamirensis]